MMQFATPTLPQFPDLTSPNAATVKLSSLGESLSIAVPDSAEIAANWDVYPILGADTQTPDWTGQEAPTGRWDDTRDEAVKLTGIELKVPKTELHKYRNQTIELRYKFADESSLEPCSEPLLLHIED
ncbi:hypothetical protein [Pseudomonas sp. NPDC086278]|uniref:hypothetical protein n=1 Tax=Pseudomonas sp. NPDC086278 TaxID=3390646 RepID=UPI003CFF12FC